MRHTTMDANRDEEFKKEWTHFRNRVLPEKLLDYFLPGVPNYPTGKGPVVVVENSKTEDRPIFQLRPKKLSQEGFVTGAYISEKELVEGIRKKLRSAKIKKL